MSNRLDRCPMCGSLSINEAVLAINYQCGTTYYDKCQGGRISQSNLCRMIVAEEAARYLMLLLAGSANSVKPRWTRKDVMQLYFDACKKYPQFKPGKEEPK